jgi:hypothetical protein
MSHRTTSPSEPLDIPSGFDQFRSAKYKFQGIRQEDYYVKVLTVVDP